MKPEGVPLFAVATSEGLLVYDEGEQEGMVVGFPSRKDAQRFIVDNDVGLTHFVVDLTDKRSI